MDDTFDWKSLRAWFLRECRDLPWRDNPSPYAVWVSEVMLQQTQVAVVIPYFEKWMRLFPTIEDLAKASKEDVIKAWEGLGYYSRARNLHEGARFVMENYSGILPNSPEELEKIKGLGPYTIGAICSFAFHQKIPAVDGNVLRVLARYFMIEDDISKPKTLKNIRNLAASLLPEDESWIVNEGLIELGATICSRKPKCHQCPLMKSCRSYSHGVADKLPFKSTNPKTESLYRAVAIVHAGGHCMIRKCDEGEIMRDLHEFPYFETDSQGISAKTFEKKLKTSYGLKAKFSHHLQLVKHSFTRYRVQLSPCVFDGCEQQPISGYQWIPIDKLIELPFSSGHRRILEMLNAK